MILYGCVHMHDSIHQEGELEVCIVKDEPKLSIRIYFEGSDHEDENDDENLESNDHVSEYKVFKHE